ncbi:SDR family NAD(P)-dependent oxidoreductase [Pseudonocardia acaciae]|uniref:SDR family NAD(P)-dependent oxidoreductase n=1 Tax=Pseudonocardia acaciae TaxID=551276 RepID=UPI00048D31BA|nr:SDR family NAD(P)-dependent oxidoreductase [Pseudonocardia acaciae]
MTRTLAVFGAGPALGLSVARRFGKEGYRVALVARDRAKLDRLEAELRTDGLTAATATADLADEAQLRSAVAAVTDTFGTPDVVLYAPGDVSRLPVSALDLGSEELRTWLPLHLLSPVALIQAVLPGMLARGSGAVLVAQGASAREPMSALASVGAPQAGLLNYLHALAAEVGPRGVYIGTLLIGALIERSAAAELWDGGHFETVEAGEVPRIEPDALAERYWEMVRDRALVEQSAP